MKYILLIIIATLTITSCFKEDEMVESHKPSDNLKAEVELGSDYNNQIYYSLHDNSIIKTNSVTEWDLAFSCKDEIFDVYLNSSKFMFAANTFDTAFNKTYNPDDYEMKFDKSTGNRDSLALRNWYTYENGNPKSKDYVFLIDRGNNENYQPMGFIKMKIEYYDNAYQIKYAKLDGSHQNSLTIQKDSLYNRAFINFDNGIVDIAPMKDKWELLFTKYTTMLYTSDGQSQPYVVVGVLLNTNNCFAVKDSLKDFNDISLTDTSYYNFSNNKDAIGYNWKYYDFDNSVYTIVEDETYIIKDYRGYFYKLKFTGFYSDTGEKGFPKFEYVRL